MNTQEILLELSKLLSQLGLFGIASYWIQKQVDKASQKRLEEFKSTLNLLNTKFTKLHEKRFIVIEQMYSRVVDLQIAMLKLTNPVKITIDHEAEMEKLIIDSNECFQNFSSFFEKNKIYFNDITCGLMEEILKTVHEAIWDFNEHRMYKQLEVDDKQIIKEARQNMIKAYNSMKDELPKLRQNLEKDFRQILNVD